MFTLATEIDELESQYKNGIGESLSQIGTYLNSSGVSSHDKSDYKGWSSLQFKQLTDGIVNSQTIPSRAYQGVKPDGIFASGNTTAATANSLTLGKAAWVNGELVIGNGADAKTAYNDGYTNGLNKTLKGATITYVYHTHKGGDGGTVYASSKPGDCYVGNGHTHNKPTACPTKGCNSTNFVTDSWHQYWDGCDWHAFSTTAGCRYHCKSCGKEYSTSWSQGQSEPAKVSKCNNFVYTCGTPVNTWKVGCGKTTATVEQAIITFE